jgi:hypothetical protein
VKIYFWFYWGFSIFKPRLQFFFGPHLIININFIAFTQNYYLSVKQYDLTSRENYVTTNYMIILFSFENLIFNINI